MYNILVTGSNGFLGRNIVDYLKEHRHQYNRIGLVSRNQPPVKDFECFKCDISEPFELPFKADIIFHLAAQANPMKGDVFFDNLLMTKNVLEYAKKLKSAIVFTSSNSIYGNRSAQQIEYPTSQYGLSKLVCEKILMTECYLNRLPLMVYNLCAMVGPHTTHGLYHDMLLKIQNNDVIECFGDYPGSCKPIMYVKETLRLMMDDIKWNFEINPTLFTHKHLHSLNPISVDRVVQIMQTHFKTNKKVVWNGKTYQGDNKYVYPCYSPEFESELKTSKEYIEISLQNEVYTRN